MIIRSKTKAEPITKPFLRYKLYKKGKMLVTSSVAGLSIVGMMVTLSQGQVHADTTTSASTTQTANATPTQQSTANSGSNSVTNQVTVDHSTLDNAVNAAKQAGMKVENKPTVSQTVQESDVPKARQDIQANESSQASEINQKVANYKHDKQNYDDYSGYKGDTSKLDASVQKAQNTAGLTVIKDADHVQAPVDASDDQAINNTKDKIQKDTDGQIPSIENAIVTQVHNNEDYANKEAAYQAAQQKYQQEVADWKASHNVTGNTISASEINQQLILGHEPNATHTINYVSSFLTPSSDLLNETGKGELYETRSSITGEVLQVTYNNLTHSSYTDGNGNKHLISKIVFTFSDLNHNAMKVNGKSYLIIKDDPAAGFWYEGSNGVTLKETFYGQDGNPINIEPGTGFLAITSLNAAYGNIPAGTVEKNGSPVHVESVSVLNGGTPIALLGSSIQVMGNQLVSPSTNDYANDGKGNLVFGLHDGTTVSSPQSASTTWQGDNWDGNSSETYWGTGLVSLNGSSITLRFESATQVRDEGTWATTQTIIPQTPGPIYDGPEKPTLKTTEISYHHDVTHAKK